MTKPKRSKSKAVKKETELEIPSSKSSKSKLILQSVLTISLEWSPSTKKAGSQSPSSFYQEILTDHPTKETFTRDEIEEQENSSIVHLEIPKKYFDEKTSICKQPRPSCPVSQKKIYTVDFVFQSKVIAIGRVQLENYVPRRRNKKWEVKCWRKLEQGMLKEPWKEDIMEERRRWVRDFYGFFNRPAEMLK